MGASVERHKEVVCSVYVRMQGLFDDDALVVGTERPAMQLQAARAAQQAREVRLQM